MSTPNESDVIFDWNIHGASQPATARKVLLVDETMRDGVQCPSVTDPSIDAKFEMLRLMAKVGVDCVDIGLPGAGPRAVGDVTRLAELIRDEKLPILPNCAARTHANDIAPIIEITQKTGVMIEVMAFLGAKGKETRFADFNRVATWITEGAPGAKVTVTRPRRARPKLDVDARGRVAAP